jgi:CheY-like chemotaxis protein
MLEDSNILVAEDETLTALDLASWVEAAGGRVVGPVATVASALALLETTPIDAAIVDANLADRDVTPVVLLLVSRNVPIIVYSGIGLPEELAARHPELPLILKPVPAVHVVKQLVQLVRAHMRARPARASPEPAADANPEIGFELVEVLVDGGVRNGRCVYASGRLIGVLVPVTAEEQGEGTAGWYLEAGFGPCGPMAAGTPPVFASLGAAATWFSGNLADAGLAQPHPR